MIWHRTRGGCDDRLGTTLRRPQFSSTHCTPFSRTPGPLGPRQRMLESEITLDRAMEAHGKYRPLHRETYGQEHHRSGRSHSSALQHNMIADPRARRPSDPRQPRVGRLTPLLIQKITREFIPEHPLRRERQGRNETRNTSGTTGSNSTVGAEGPTNTRYERTRAAYPIVDRAGRSRVTGRLRRSMRVTRLPLAITGRHHHPSSASPGSCRATR